MEFYHLEGISKPFSENDYDFIIRNELVIKHKKLQKH